VKPNFSNRIINVGDSGLGCFLTLVVLSLLLGSVGLQWVVNGVVIFILLLTVTPIIGFWLFRWWLKRNLVQDNCPVCNYELTGLNNTDCRCPNCGEVLNIEGGKFIRKTPPGTIEVEVVDVSEIEEK
jgi:hypothetical protein